MKLLYKIIILILLFTSLLFSSNKRNSLHNESEDIENYKPKFKSVKTAFTIALTNTIIPFTLGTVLVENEKVGYGLLLLGYGVTIGPSTGSLYANDNKRAILGIALRTVSSLVNIGSGLSTLSDSADLKKSSKIIKTTYGIIVISSIYSIIASKSSVLKYNKRIEKFIVKPVYNPGNKSFCLSFKINFN